jgi:hypothetical protein
MIPTSLRPIVVMASVLATAAPCVAGAQHSGAPRGAPRSQCLSGKDLELIARLKALARPTTEKDPPPPFDPDYFVGTWTMEWDAPETPLARPKAYVRFLHMLDQGFASRTPDTPRRCQPMTVSG